MALTDKVLMLGVDGLDPTLTRKFVDQGKLPNMTRENSLTFRNLSNAAHRNTI